MFIHNIDPVLFNIGFIEIRYYGLVYLLGFLLVLLFLKKYKSELKLKEEHIYDLIFYLFLSILFGARLFYFLIEEPYTLIRQPLEFFKIWNGGMSFFGSLIFVLISIFLYCKKNKINFYLLGDILVFPTTIALILGRLANFINGELVGTVSNLQWCVIFNNYLECRHPYQIYASLSHLILLCILFKVKKVKEKLKLKDGIILLSFVFFYSLIRFLVDFFRDEPRIFGLTIWQYLSLVFIIASIFYYRKFK